MFRVVRYGCVCVARTRLVRQAGGDLALALADIPYSSNGSGWRRKVGQVVVGEQILICEGGVIDIQHADYLSILSISWISWIKEQESAYRVFASFKYISTVKCAQMTRKYLPCASVDPIYLNRGAL